MNKYSVKKYCLIISAILFVACNSNKPQQQQQAPPPTPVAVYKVEEGKATYFDEYPGTVTALNEVELRAQVSGYVTGIFFRDGQHVTKGQKLYSIDQRQYQANYQQAVANLNVSEANLAKAQQDADRYTELEKHDAIAKQVVDHALADLQAAKMQVQAAKANVENVQTNVRYSTIYAPLSGTIGISNVKLGAVIAPDQTILNTISSDDPMAVDFYVDEKQIPRFVQLQHQKNNHRDSTFTLVLSDQSLYPFPGRIALLDRAIDPQTGTLKTRLVFDNENNVLRAGMNCNVRIKNNGDSAQLLIPYKAITEQMGEYFVYVVDSSKAKQRKIILGTRINDKIIVKDGLKENEQIVTEGVQKLKNGATIKIVSDSTKLSSQ
ncbi:MAG: efflux RND transporter periplasmic adaptor subunit [Chitinophagaceae bacterium]